ncbi:hypothetical protein D3C84_1041530 [compost metagenome]
MDRQQVAIENTNVFHAHAMNPQQIIGARVEERRVDVAGFFDMLLGKDWRASCDPANDWQG